MYMISLAPLPFAREALAPVIDATTIDIHYGKHHQTYVDKLNGLLPGTPYEGLDLLAIITQAPAGPIFNNAAQVWNHTFYWNCLTAQSSGGDQAFEQIMSSAFAQQVLTTWGSLDAFKEAFTTSAINNFWSGRTRLVKNSEGNLEIVNTSNAGCPLTAGQTPLLTLDVWEHAYYLGYQNRRADYVAQWWTIVNRAAVAQHI